MKDSLFIGKKEEGFSLPNGYSWDATLKNGMKEGKVTVKDEDGCLSHVFYYLKDKRNGICKFYDSGTIKEKRTFVNDIEEGWACEIENKEEVRWFLYSNGIKTAELMRCEDMDNYWKAVDISSNQAVSVCKYDDNHIPVDKGYMYKDGHIQRVVLFENGKESAILKRFEGNEMIEYDNSDNIIYKGSYVDDYAKDYEREGIGKQYVNGELVYKGEWKRNKREGQGKTLKNGIAVYEGKWKEGLPNGFGILDKNGKVYKGNWVMGKLELNKDETLDYTNELKEEMREIDKKKPESIPLIPEHELIKTVTVVIENTNQLRELLSNEEEKRSVTELIIGTGCGNEMSDDLELCGFDNLESLYVRQSSLMYLKSLKISNNPMLKRIETENGQPYHNGMTGTGAFSDVKSVTISGSLLDR